VIDVVRETAPTGWAFFHLLAQSRGSIEVEKLLGD
jgi:hypothetical protein